MSALSRRKRTLPASIANARLLALLTSAISSCGARTGLLVETDRDVLDAPDGGSGVDARDIAPDGARAHDASADGGATDAAADVPRVEAGGSARRPFLVGSSLRSASPVAASAWAFDYEDRRPALPPRSAACLARAWLKDALDEHASVAAFARFALQLLSVGAPPELVAATHRAALDEVHHARLCFGLAHRYGADHRGPGPLPLHDVRVDTTLIELVALAVEEGCVGETLGAALAMEQLAVATDPEVKRALSRIARDESRHAALGWSFLRWAILQGGADVRAAATETLDRAIEGALALKLEPSDVDVADWHAHGRLTCQEARSRIEDVVRNVLRPCAAAALQPGREVAAGRGIDVARSSSGKARRPPSYESRSRGAQPLPSTEDPVRRSGSGFARHDPREAASKRGTETGRA